ncbi:hypothetical protein U9M48_027382 [Paspalum notatum var. saurae]|uniref:Uncharacterized protein n=1 Tax=Paspalum notatum var. saurae TaxID=547442 RepID=A0AAQ3TUN6_PASNO
MEAAAAGGFRGRGGGSGCLSWSERGGDWLEARANQIEHRGSLAIYIVQPNKPICTAIARSKSSTSKSNRENADNSEHSPDKETTPQTILVNHIRVSLGLVEDNTLVLHLEPLHGILLGHPVLDSNTGLAPAAAGDTVASTLKDNIKSTLQKLHCLLAPYSNITGNLLITPDTKGTNSVTQFRVNHTQRISEAT